MRFRSMKVLGLLIALSMAMLMIMAEASAQKNQASEQPATEEKKEERSPGLAELVSMSSELNERLSRLQAQIGNVLDTGAAQKWYDATTVKLDTLTERVQVQKSIEKPTYQDLAELKGTIRQEDSANNDQIDKITSAIHKVESWRLEWLKEYQRWTKWQETLPQSFAIRSVEDTFTRTQKIISEALDLIRENIEPLLIGQQKVEELQYRVYKLDAEVDRLILAVRGDVLQKKTPVMFSARFFSNLRRALFFELPRQLRISWPGKGFFVDDAWVIILQIVVALGIALGIRRRREQLQGMPEWRFVAKRPYAAGLAFAVPILSVFYGPLPAVWRLLEIDRRFRDLEIEIPFPQSDLHLRSVDSPAAASLQPLKSEGTAAAPMIEVPEK